MVHLTRVPLLAKTDPKPKLKPNKKSWIDPACNPRPSFTWRRPRLCLAEYAPNELVRAAWAWYRHRYAPCPSKGLPGTSQLAKTGESVVRRELGQGCGIGWTDGGIINHPILNELDTVPELERVIDDVSKSLAHLESPY